MKYQTLSKNVEQHVTESDQDRFIGSKLMMNLSWSNSVTYFSKDFDISYLLDMQVLNIYSHLYGDFISYIVYIPWLPEVGAGRMEE